MERVRWARWWWGGIVAAAVVAVGLFSRPAPQQRTANRGSQLTRFRILLGIGDDQPTRWDGSLRVTGGRIRTVEVWRPAAGDAADGQTFRLTTSRLPPQGAAAKKAGRPGPMQDNGLLIAAELLDAAARFDVETAQGSFSFRADQVSLGDSRSFLDGRVSVERIPSTTRLTDSPEEQDFPAIAQAGDALYIAYVEFTHGDRSQKWPQQIAANPGNFDALARPAGGDQVLLLEYSRSRNTAGAPLAVTPPGQDVARAAVAVDGGNRVWVFWSAQVKGNFDIYARARSGGVWGEPLRLTQDPGPDLNPVAVTDTAGGVWVAWQGWRQGGFDVLAARQREGNGFLREERVSTSPANDWDPQLASGPGGEVAAVWDTYDKGDYDVYLRRLRFAGEKIALDPPQPVAASSKFEARPSVAYGREKRIFVAYEESYPRWGKDFGAYETTGSGLYQGNTVRVKILDGDQYYTTADPLGDTLDSAPGREPPELPDPELVKQRRPHATPYPAGFRSKGLPRLASDNQGIIFLAYRAAAPTTRGPLGSVWFENLAYFDGRDWTGPIFLPDSDNVLDNRPAILSVGPGQVVVVGSSDGRHSSVQRPLPTRRAAQERFHNDLFLSELDTGARWRRAEHVAVAPDGPDDPDPEVKAELEQVALMRSYRVELGKEKLQLLRGEFHRHTEYSGDGGRDGPLIDAFRYMLDAAYMDWGGCCDHDNGNGREYTWWITQKLTDAFHVPGRFVPMFSYERSVRYPEGHRNVILAQRGVRPLPRLPKMPDDSPPSPAPDTQMLYQYLRRFDGIAAVHTSGTDMGTDWRDNDPKVEPVVEIYQGDRQNYEMPEAPRSNNAQDSIGGWRPLGFVSLALQKGYRLGFQASSDHISTHMSYCNLWVTEPTRKGVLEAFKKRRVYGATDNILAEVTCNGHFMGEEFTVTGKPLIEVKLIGTAQFRRVHIIKDGAYVYTGDPRAYRVHFGWRDENAKPGTTSYYYVRGEQVDGELVWVTPMWITVK
jgi:hypothetical protein